MSRASEIINRAVSRRQFMTGMGAGALVAAVLRTQKADAAFGPYARGGGASSAFNGYYPSGHYNATPPFPFNTSNPVANLIYPRPDTETPIWARHRCMFYDGTHQMPNYIYLAIRGGSFPYVIEQVSAPAGTTLLAGIWQPNWTIADAIAAGYGVIKCIPQASFSGQTFQYRVTDQLGASFLITWTGSTYGTWTSAAGAGFVFLDPVNGTDPTSYSTVPSITSPMKTANWAFNQTYSTSSYPNAILVCRAGTVPLFQQTSGGASGITLRTGVNPTAIIAYPGESVSLDATNSGTTSAFQVENTDFFIDGFSQINGPSASTNFNHFLFATKAQRAFANGISLPDVFVGTAPTNNGGPFLFTGQSAYSTYLWLRAISSVAGSATVLNTNGFTGATFFTADYCGVELSSFTGMDGTAVDLKASVSDATIRACAFVQGASGSFPLLAYDQQNSSLAQDNQEFCYNVVDTSAAGYGAALTLNELQTASNNIGTSASYRNSYVGYGAVGAPTGNGPFSFTNDAIQYGTGNSPVEILGGGSLPSNVTNTGTDSQAATGIFTDPATGDYSLVNSARNGLDGANIA